MSSIKKFEDLDIWNESKVFTIKIYNLKISSIDNSFHDQICRASISILNNIAEGFERSSDGEFIRFLYYSKASCAEVRSMLYISQELFMLNPNTLDKLIADSKMISSKIGSLIKYLKNSKGK